MKEGSCGHLVGYERGKVQLWLILCDVVFWVRMLRSPTMFRAAAEAPLDR